MVGVLESANYKYTDVELASGAKVSATGVTIKDGKVIKVGNGRVTIGEVKEDDIFGSTSNGFSFSVRSESGKLVYDTSSVPADYNGQDIAEEFIAFVETDMV